jgi:hypothetical protein
VDEADRELEDRVSRRRMIKRLGAATAVAWTAPVLSTLGATPAFAQAQPCPECGPPVEDPDPTGNCPSTGAFPCGSDGPNLRNPCTCLRTIEGGCFCHSCIDCGAIPGGFDAQCGSSAECPAGWGCVLSNCGCDPAVTPDPSFQCHPPCGGGTGVVPNPDPCAAQGAGAAGSGRTSIG